MQSRSSYDSTASRAAKWVALIALVLLCLLGVFLSRIAPIREAVFGIGVKREPASSGAPGVPQERSLSRPGVGMDVDTPAVQIDAPTPAPSAECLASRARDARREAELRALSAVELERHIEIEARAPRMEDRAITQAQQTCADAPELARKACVGTEALALFIERELDERAAIAALREHAGRVAARGDARSLLGAADILPVGEVEPGEPVSGTARPRQAIEWVVKAQQIGRDDPLVQWGVVQFVHEANPGSFTLDAAKAAARQRLLVLEPDNAAVLLLAAPDPHPDRRAIHSARQLERANALPRFSQPTGNVRALGLDALRGMPPLPAFRRVALARNREHDTATHCASDALILEQQHLHERRAFQRSGVSSVVGWACHTEIRPQSAAQQANCRQLFEKAYAGSETMATTSIAVGGILERSVSDAERERWTSVARRLAWLGEQSTRLWRADDPYQRARFEALGLRSGHERAGVEARLREADIPLDPPPGWQPSIRP